MNLDKETGVSIMQITPKLDAGPILMKSKLKIKSDIILKISVKSYAKLGSSIIKIVRTDREQRSKIRRTR